MVVDVDATITRRLRSGDFFGELATKDWGSGLGYPRLPTITAESPARLRQIPSEVFGELLATEPTLHAAGQSAVCERIPVSEDSLSSSTQSTRGCAAYSARQEPLAAS